MSVWVTAVLGHPWGEYSPDTIQRISWAATGARPEPEWYGGETCKSPAEQFKTCACVSFFMPRDYSLRFSRRILELTLAIRWSAFLIHKGERRQFMSACMSVARLAGVDEVILLPEGTEMADLLYAEVSYAEFKQSTIERLGPPDLDIQQIYSKRGLERLRQKRVHYFTVAVHANRLTRND